jgi:hypothetical protein
MLENLNSYRREGHTLWTAYSSYRDTLDLPSALNRSSYGGHNAVAEVGYAYAVIAGDRQEDAPA